MKTRLTNYSCCLNRFEAQLTAVKERLEAAKVGSTRGLGSPTGSGLPFGSRIAKPLRGGGAVAEAGPLAAIASPEQPSKRSSWFFNQRA